MPSPLGLSAEELDGGSLVQGSCSRGHAACGCATTGISLQHTVLHISLATAHAFIAARHRLRTNVPDAPTHCPDPDSGMMVSPSLRNMPEFKAHWRHRTAVPRLTQLGPRQMLLATPLACCYRPAERMDCCSLQGYCCPVGHTDSGSAQNLVGPHSEGRMDSGRPVGLTLPMVGVVVVAAAAVAGGCCCSRRGAAAAGRGCHR